MSVGKPGIGFGRDFEWLGAPFGETVIDCFTDLDFDNRIRQRIGHRADMFRFDSRDRHAVAANRARDEKRPRFDPIRNDVVLGAVQFFHAFDDQSPRPGAFDFRAHLVQEIRQIADLRLRGRAFDHRDAFGQNGGHHDVIGPENGRAEFAAQIDDGAFQFRRENLHVPALPLGPPRRALRILSNANRSADRR